MAWRLRTPHHNAHSGLISLSSIIAKDIPENGPDAAHLHFLHPPFVMATPFSPFIAHDMEASWVQNLPPREHTASIPMEIYFKIFGKRAKWTLVRVHVEQMGPGVVSLHFRTFLGNIYMVCVVYFCVLTAQIETVTPVGVRHLVARHCMLSDVTVPRVVARIVFMMMIRQFERDIPIWNSKSFKRTPAFVKSDARVVAFRRWFAQFYPKNPLDW
jgi:hypothetical protein